MTPLIRKLTRAMALLSGALGLVGCSGADVLNFTIPRDGYRLQRGLSYGEHPRQTLDIYTPEQAENAPVVLFFYGGSWQWGDKTDYLFLGQALASRGYVVAVADYRLYPEVYFPDFVLDSGRALVWVHQHIAGYGGNPAQLFVAGHSAGAYNAVMLSLNEPLLKKAGAKREWIKGVIGLAGPYDFLPFTDPDIKAVFSKVPAHDTQPVNFVGGKLPPFFLATGTDDDTVIPRNSKRLAARLAANHTSVELHEYDSVAHIGIVLSLARGFRGKAPLLDDLHAFMQHTLAAAH